MPTVEPGWLVFEGEAGSVQPAPEFSALEAWAFPGFDPGTMKPKIDVARDVDLWMRRVRLARSGDQA